MYKLAIVVILILVVAYFLTAPGTNPVKDLVGKLGIEGVDQKPIRLPSVDDL